jgi:hypothetical protein
MTQKLGVTGTLKKEVYFFTELDMHGWSKLQTT